MNANTLASPRPSAAERFDAKFIEEHALIERYLDRKLPPRGARDLENWCRANPQYLESLKLAERAEATLKLLEAAGRSVDLSEPAASPGKRSLVLAGLCLLTAMSLLVCWALYARYTLLHGELAEAKTHLAQGSLIQPSTLVDVRIAPDRTPGLGRARIAVTRAAPQLVDLRIDMGYSKDTQFRVTVDKKDQGRALVISNLLKDSNGELRLTFNTTGLAPGRYEARIDSQPLFGSPSAQGWVVLDVT